MRPRSDKAFPRSLAAARVAAPCLVVLVAAGCASEHLFRAQDRKLEELRLERARQDEAIGRAREAIDALREEWKALAARESTATKEAASLQGAIRKLAQRIDESEGKRGKLEDRLRLAETRSTELNQAFTQVSSMFKAAENDLLALRIGRGGSGLPSFASPGGWQRAEEPAGGLPQDGKRAVADTGSSKPRTVGALLDALLDGETIRGVFKGGVLIAAGAVAMLLCMFIRAHIRALAPRRDLEVEKPKTARDLVKREALEAARPAPRTQPARLARPASQPAGSPVSRDPAHAAARQQGEPKVEAETAQEPVARADVEAPPSALASPDTSTACKPAGAAAASAPEPRITPAPAPTLTAPSTLDASAPVPERIVFPPDALDDVFEAAENASARYARAHRTGARAQEAAEAPHPQSTELIEQETEHYDHAHTELLETGAIGRIGGDAESGSRDPAFMGPRRRPRVVSIARRPRSGDTTTLATPMRPALSDGDSGPLTDRIDGADAPERTQVIEGADRPAGTDLIDDGTSSGQTELIDDGTSSGQTELIDDGTQAGQTEVIREGTEASLTDVIGEANSLDRTQVIAEATLAARPSTAKALNASTHKLSAGKQPPRGSGADLQKKTNPPDEKDLLDELENIIGYKMGEKGK